MTDLWPPTSTKSSNSPEIIPRIGRNRFPPQRILVSQGMPSITYTTQQATFQACAWIVPVFIWLWWIIIYIDRPTHILVRCLPSSFKLPIRPRHKTRVGLEPTHRAFAELCLTTWLPRHTNIQGRIRTGNYQILSLRPLPIGLPGHVILHFLK